MENFLSGGVMELNAAKEAIIDDAKKAADLEEVTKTLRSKEKDLQAEQKLMEDKISSSVKTARSEILKNHDSVLNEIKKDLKNAEKDKAAAKQKAVNQRIKSETSDLVSENERINGIIKDQLKQWKLPGFCNSRYYFAMFAPKNAADFFIFALSVLIAAALIPNLVCYFLPLKTFFKVLIYIGIVVVFVLLYIIVFSSTKTGAKADIIEKIRPYRKMVAENKKLIKKQSKSIKGDVDESSYGLADFDTEIARCQSELAEKESAKVIALQEFDNNTSKTIQAQIEAESLPVIQTLEQEIRDLKEDQILKQNLSREAQTNLSKNFTAYLGQKNMDPEKIDALIAVINEGKAQTILQAMDVVNTESK